MGLGISQMIRRRTTDENLPASRARSNDTNSQIARQTGGQASGQRRGGKGGGDEGGGCEGGGGEVRATAKQSWTSGARRWFSRVNPRVWSKVGGQERITPNVPTISRQE